MLANRHSLLDEVVEILRDGGSKTVGLQDTEDLASGNVPDLPNTLGITELTTNLRGGHTLVSELADLLADLVVGDLQPRRSPAAVRDGGSGDTFSME